MAVGVVATYNNSDHSPGFDISVTGVGGFDTLTVERIDLSGEYPPTPIRGGDQTALFGDIFAASDYEAPVGKPLVYEARATARTVTDGFSRDATNGWGDAPGGLPWAVSDTASLYRTMSGVGETHIDALNSSRRTWLPGLDIADVDVTCDVRAAQAATGGTIELGVTGRYADSDNYYMAEVLFHAGGSMTLRLRRVVGGIFTTLATAGMPFEHNPARWYRVRLQIVGQSIRAKLWEVGTRRT